MTIELRCDPKVLEICVSNSYFNNPVYHDALLASCLVRAIEDWKRFGGDDAEFFITKRAESLMREMMEKSE